MRWFTSTPCNFDGDQTFFDRDSGLTMRGFTALGIESGSITLGPAKATDLPAMTRATHEEMESPEWWASMKLDGLVFYTWGQAQYAGMVRAAMQSGAKVAQVTDAQGVSSILSDWRANLSAESAHYWYEPRWKQLGRTLIKLPYTSTVRLVKRDLAHARAIAASDLFFAASPSAAERYRNFVRRAVNAERAQRVHMVPIPVNFHFRFSAAEPKQNEIIAVGRWDSLQKRTSLLTGTLSLALKRVTNTTVRIFGTITPELESWYAGLSANQRRQVTLEGLVSNSTIAEAYRRARVMLVSAAYEGCHNASAEAICSGASVVGCRSPFLGAIEWHTSKNSGRLTDQATPDSLAATLLDELAAWDCGHRDPAAISQAWIRELHPDRVAARILELFEQTPPAATP
jgi:hypothetical protein